MGVNKVILIGRVGKDPEVRHLDSGVAVANFSLATNKNYKNKNGEKVEETQWHNIVIWRKLAEVVEQYVNKGDLLYLEGELTNRSWNDKEGNKKYITEVICNNMEMLGGKPADKREATVKNDDAAPLSDEPDDFPF